MMGMASKLPGPKPVRITVDLDPELYRQLCAWTDWAAVTFAIPRVPHAVAIRAMIRAEVEDPAPVISRLGPPGELLPESYATMVS